MQENYIIKENQSLTAIARNIFGDIALKAYISETYYSDASKESALRIVNREVNDSSNVETSISYDGASIVVEFVNGNSVIFTSSEWGHMDKFAFDENVICV